MKLIRCLVGFTAAQKTLFQRELRQQTKHDIPPLQNPPDEESLPHVLEDFPRASPSHSPSSEVSVASLEIALPSNSHSSVPHKPTPSTKINGVAFEVVLGDITDEQTEAIVNPTDDELQLDGKLSKAIVSKGGSVITEECRTRGSIAAGGTVVTSGGSLSCRLVVHVVAPDDMQQCQRAVMAVFRQRSPTNFNPSSFRPSEQVEKGFHSIRWPAALWTACRRSQSEQHREPQSRSTCGL